MSTQEKRPETPLREEPGPQRKHGNNDSYSLPYSKTPEEVKVKSRNTHAFTIRNNAVDQEILKKIAGDGYGLVSMLASQLACSIKADTGMAVTILEGSNLE